MKIGIFTEAYSPLISGVVTSINNLKDGLEALGHEVYVITPYAPKQKYEFNPSVIRLKGFPIPKKSLKGFRLVFFTRRHLRKIKALNLDIIHIHTEFSMGRLGLHAAKKFNLPVCYTVHTSYQDYTHHISKFMTKFTPRLAKKIAFMINNKFTKKADITIVPTKKIYDKMINLKHKGTFTIVPTGIDLEPFYQENHKKEDVIKLREFYNIKDDEFVALLVSRIAREKSINDLVDAFTEFHKTNPKSKFYIIGDGPDKNLLDQHIKKLKANDFIITLGFITYDKVPLYYQMADVFLNASTTETQGLTYIEALAASLPIIVRKDEVFEDFVINNENGIFFEKTEELTEILLKVYNNGTLKKLTENARDSVLKYSKENYAKNLESLYQDLIDKKQLK
ncbi:MAG: glycosyltransferase [Acholeplasmataceae bacterium]